MTDKQRGARVEAFLREPNTGGTVIRATPYRWRDPATIPPMPWLYGFELQRGMVSLLIATGGLGKSTLEVGNALAMVTNRPLMGRRVHGGPLRVWYWNLEDDGDQLARQIQAACLHWGIGAEDMGDRLFVDSAIDRGVPLRIAEQGRYGVLINRPIVSALIAELRARKVDVLIVDPFVASHAVGENDNGAMEAVVKEWVRVAYEANCAVRLVAHTRKLAGTEADPEATRGGSSLVDGARSAIVLNRMTAQEAERLGVKDHRNFFRALDGKPNRAPPAERSDWFERRSIDLGNTTNVRPSDLIGVAVPWSPPNPLEGIPSDSLRRVQAALGDRSARKDQRAKAWVGYVVAETLGLDASDKAERSKIASLVGIWIENHALIVVQDKDENGDERPFVKVGRWFDDPSAPT